jgi:SAM-dependent methyltransferase
MLAAAAGRQRSRRPRRRVAGPRQGRGPSYQAGMSPGVPLASICPGRCWMSRGDWAAQAGVMNAGFVQGDAQICPLRRGSCDVMISSFGVMFFDDPAAAFASMAGALRRRGRLAFLCWQHDMHNELFAIPLRAFGAHTRLPVPAVGELFTNPRRVTELLSDTGWDDIQIGAVSEPAWIGSDVADVMSYVRGMPMIRNLAADLGNEVLAERVLAVIAGQYAARERPDGVWVRAAAWLVTAHRA